MNDLGKEIAFLKLLIEELCFNAFEHSEGAAVFFSTYFKNSKSFDISLSDSGIGIFKGVEKNYPDIYSNSNRSELIKRIFQKGLFNLGIKRFRGRGLSYACKSVQKLRATLKLITEDRTLEIDENGDLFIYESPLYYGTHFNIIIRTEAFSRG